MSNVQFIMVDKVNYESFFLFCIFYLSVRYILCEGGGNSSTFIEQSKGLGYVKLDHSNRELKKKNVYDIKLSVIVLWRLVVRFGFVTLNHVTLFHIMWYTFCS